MGKEVLGKYACFDCGFSKNEVFVKCERCGGMRIYLTSILHQMFANDPTSVFYVEPEEAK